MTIDAVNAISITLFDETLGKDTSDPLGITINRSHLDWYRTGDRTDPPLEIKAMASTYHPMGNVSVNLACLLQRVMASSRCAYGRAIDIWFHKRRGWESVLA